MVPRSLVWKVAVFISAAWSSSISAGEYPVGPIPPPGAMPEPAGQLAGYHQRNYGGCKQGLLPSIWGDLDYVYRRDMNDVFTYKPWKWRYGYPVGYGIGAGCQAGGPFGTTERCCLTPLHYSAEAPRVFVGPRPELPGASWYRLDPAGAAGPTPGCDAVPTLVAPQRDAPGVTADRPGSNSAPNR